MKKQLFFWSLGALTLTGLGAFVVAVEPLPSGFPCQCAHDDVKPALQQPAEHMSDAHPPVSTETTSSPTTGAERSLWVRTRRSSADSAESQPAKDCKACEPKDCKACEPKDCKTCEPAPAKAAPEQADSSTRKSANGCEEKLPPTDVVGKGGQSAVPAPSSSSADITAVKAEQSSAASPASLRVPEVMPPLSGVAAVELPTTAPLMPVPPAPLHTPTTAHSAASESAKQGVDMKNDPHYLLQQGRDLFASKRLDEAEEVARRVAAVPVRWGLLEDSPRKLLDDIQKARQHAKNEDASIILAEARRLYAKGQLDEAERLARLAERMHGPYRLIDTSDRPQALLAEIEEARLARTQGQKPAANSTAVTQVPQLGTSVRAWVGAFKPMIRVGEPASVQVVQAASSTDATKTVETAKTDAAKTTEVTKSVEVTKSADTPKSAEAKTQETAKTAGSTEKSGVVTASATLPVKTSTELTTVAAHTDASTPAGSPLPLPAGMANAIAADGKVKRSESTRVLAAGEVVVVEAAPPAKGDKPAKTDAPAKTETATKTEPGPLSCLFGSDCCDDLRNMCQNACQNVCNMCQNTPTLCLMGDVGFSIMHPYFKNNPAFLFTTFGTQTTQQQIDFDLGTQFVPQVSVGVVGTSDWGFRVNWWQFATGDHQQFDKAPFLRFSAAPLGQGFLTSVNCEADARLSMTVWDFEVTHDWQVCDWCFLLAGGLRYAHIAQRYDAVTFDTFVLEAVRSGHSFDGVGPTLYFKARRHLADSGAYLFSDVRGSLLAGRARQQAFNILVPATFIDAESSSHMLLPVGELELGLGWRKDLSGVDFFVETALTGQIWFEAGNSSRSTLSSVTTSTISPTVDYNLGLLGFTMRVGVNY